MAFTPTTTRAPVYFTVGLIVSISLLCSILPNNLISNCKKFVVKIYLVFTFIFTIDLVVNQLGGSERNRTAIT
jgi:hypothetical protein